MCATNLLNKNILLSLLLLPLANIILFICGDGDLDCSIAFLGKQLALGVAVSFAEELFFRGLLLKELVFGYKWKALVASCAVSFVFAVMHLFNVNSYATWGYALVQSICAFAVSVNLCAVFIVSRRLLWCIAIHALINITSIGLDGSGGQLGL